MNSVSIDVKEMCLVSIQFVTCSDKIWCDVDKIWCDVVTIDVGHIILGCSWLYDLYVTIYECLNSCSFIHNEKVKLASLRPAPLPETKLTDASNSKEALTLICNSYDFDDIINL